MRFYTVSKLGRNPSLNRLIRNATRYIDQYVEEDNIAKCGSASAVVRNTIQWERNFTISLANEKDLHNLFGHRSSVSTFAGVWFSLNNAFSLLPAQTSSIFHAYAANGSGPIAHSPLAVRRKQKSKLGRSEYTRIPRLPMEFNICCLRYETHGHAFFFHPFPHSFTSSLTIHSSRSFLNAIEEVSAERETRSLLKIHDRIERDGTAFGTQIELNSCIAYTSFSFGCIACQFRILWSQVTTLIYSRE